MTIRAVCRAVVLCVGWVCGVGVAGAQVIESVGDRAQGMGGAFVAVANDSTATWWNPAALAAGPFVDISIGHGMLEQDQALPSTRDRASWIALGTPAVGLLYYQTRITDAQPPLATDGGAGGREEVRAGVPISSLTVRQLGGTVVYTVVPGLHIGSTLKWVWGSGGIGVGDPTRSPDDWLEQGEDLDHGNTAHHFDLDAGVLATVGALRLGGLVKNLREPTFGAHRWELPRQYRAGAAVDLAAVGGIPLTVAVDVDLEAYMAGERRRRMVAVGGEQWLFEKRLGLRGGARFNQVGDKARIVTGGASVAVRPGSFIEGHVVYGRDVEERGWGAGARVSF
jgi:hypothetical protein